MLNELPFYDELTIVKKQKHLKNMQEVIMKDKDWNMTDPLVHLGASEPVIKSSFKDLLIEMKRFKYQITLNVLLSKKKEKGIFNCLF